jgi:Xaa-Pro aminopeptidase
MALFIERLAELKKIGRKAGLDAFFVNSETNMRYLAGLSVSAIERFAGIIIPIEDKTPTVIVPRLEEQKVKEQSVFKDIRSYDDSESPAPLLKRAISDAGLEKPVFGFEEMLPFRFYRMLVKCSPKMRVKEVSTLFSQLRRVKSQDELKKMEKAANILALCIKTGIDSIKPGVTKAGISFEIEKTIRERGGEGVPFCIILSGSNSAMPHGNTSSRKVKEKDVVLMDVGAIYEGYYADLTRTVFVGEVTKKQKEVYGIVAKAQEAAIEAVRPNVRAEQVDGAARKTIEDAEYGDYFTHRTGHGLGLEVHEEPYITKGNKTVLQPGMTFTIEPGIYLPSKFGVRIEDDVVVSANGGSLLSHLSRELQVI